MHLIQEAHMSDPTSFSEDLPTNFDDRPLPERIASRYNFPLAYHDVDSKRYYAVQDWIQWRCPSRRSSRFFGTHETAIQKG